MFGRERRSEGASTDKLVGRGGKRSAGARSHTSTATMNGATWAGVGAGGLGHRLYILGVSTILAEAQLAQCCSPPTWAVTHHPAGGPAREQQPLPIDRRTEKERPPGEGAWACYSPDGPEDAISTSHGAYRSGEEAMRPCPPFVWPAGLTEADASSASCRTNTVGMNPVIRATHPPYLLLPLAIPLCSSVCTKSSSSGSYTTRATVPRQTPQSRPRDGTGARVGSCSELGGLALCLQVLDNRSLP